MATAFLGVLLTPGLLRAVQTLTIDTTQVSFGTVTAADYGAGYIEKLNANTLTVESDIDWKVEIHGSSNIWVCTGPDCQGIKIETTWNGESREAATLIS